MLPAGPGGHAARLVRTSPRSGREETAPYQRGGAEPVEQLGGGGPSRRRERGGGPADRLTTIVREDARGARTRPVRLPLAPTKARLDLLGQVRPRGPYTRVVETRHEIVTRPGSRGGPDGGRCGVGRRHPATGRSISPAGQKRVSGPPCRPTAADVGSPRPGRREAGGPDCCVSQTPRNGRQGAGVAEIDPAAGRHGLRCAAVRRWPPTWWPAASPAWGRSWCRARRPRPPHRLAGFDGDRAGPRPSGPFPRVRPRPSSVHRVRRAHPHRRAAPLDRFAAAVPPEGTHAAARFAPPAPTCHVHGSNGVGRRRVRRISWAAGRRRG
ncbi:hypothetical protein FHR81_004438 [Actinoalloteichus hoggarensis]|uniref:Uncharacterized protein n=1 Tax=Actinoalloteichus hoggarensis TaxID=1470176 RepID=A0A221W3U9_9PSEU|nr:hypothetical protein AHOG_13430 [Actinoalloteichus hoggarensis]MBB5923367.1 hypothetical protein [Actinoalloteichus hoggarensis]